MASPGSRIEFALNVVSYPLSGHVFIFILIKQFTGRMLTKVSIYDILLRLKVLLHFKT